MSSIAIVVTPPGDGPSDITDACIFADCTFTGRFNAVPGEFSVKVRDPDRTLSFVTGSEITLEVDGSLLFGGYVTMIEMGSMAPAADTTDLDHYELRTWTLSGPDNNIIFDKRVWRNMADYLSFITYAGPTTDGAILADAIANFADLSDYSTSGIVAVQDWPDGDVLQQGVTLRKDFDRHALLANALYYATPDKTFVYCGYDALVKRWGFSDAPNRTPITASPDSYQGATYPFREVTGNTDATYMANDVFIWGGGPFGSPAGGMVFDRESDATSITDHGRWQHAETHIGESGYQSTAGVTAAATAILDGPPGTDSIGEQKGLKFPQSQYTFTWFSADVPLLSGVPNHVIPGNIMAIELTQFGVSTLLPVRELTMSFPDALDTDGSHVVEFRATFGLQLSDPFTLWRFLQSQAGGPVTSFPSVVDNNSIGSGYGAQYSGVPSPAPDGAETVFTIPFGYITGSTDVYLNGLLQRLTTDYTESDPAAGEITFTSAPFATDNIVVVALTLLS